MSKKYLLQWCELCEQVIIQCDGCGNATCNGASCLECFDDFMAFDNDKDKPQYRAIVEEINPVYWQVPEPTKLKKG